MTQLNWQSDDGILEFETKLLKGILQANGHHQAITQLIYKPTSTRLDNGMMLAPYRLLSHSGWMGEARSMAHQATAIEDGLQIVWSPTHAHQATLSTHIRFREPGYIDTDIDVVGHAFYPNYEVFMSAYFREGFRSGGYLSSIKTKSSNAVVQVRPEHNPIFQEMYLSFPRDEAAAHVITDGRWQRGRHHTRFLPARFYGLPLGFYSQVDGPVEALFMGLPDDVYSVNMAYFTDDPNDHVGQHNSLYLSLFGQDLHPGERWQTTVRFTVGEFGGDQDMHQEEYRQFLSSCVSEDLLEVDSTTPLFEYLT
jgi:hypothetical protein